MAHRGDIRKNGCRRGSLERDGHRTGGSKAHHRHQYQEQQPFQKRPFIIGVAGGTASGKSTVCSKIMQKLGPIDPASVYLSHEKRVICISQDSFYRKLSDTERARAAKGNFNFDHPSAFDANLLVSTLRDVHDGKMVKVPLYNYIANEIGDGEEVIYPADVVLVEGLLLFYFPEVREMFHMKVFVDTDPDTRLSRRVIRDVTERNRSLDSVLAQYTKYVKPSFEEFCLPTKKYADIIVPRGPDNEVAVDLIVTHVRSVYDPSTRHQSIIYSHEMPLNGAAYKHGNKQAKKKKHSLRANGTQDQHMVNGNKCYTPTVNSCGLKDDDCSCSATHRSKPINIGNGAQLAVMAGFSSSAPCHLNGFAAMYEALNKSGEPTDGFEDDDYHNEENELPEPEFETKKKESTTRDIFQSCPTPQHKACPSTIPIATAASVAMGSKIIIEAKANGATVNGTQKQQQPATPILVASR